MNIAPIQNAQTGGFNSLNLLAVDILKVHADGKVTTGYEASSFSNFRKGSLDTYADILHNKHRHSAIQDRLILQVDFNEADEDGIDMTHLISNTKMNDTWKGFDELHPAGASSRVFLKGAKQIKVFIWIVTKGGMSSSKILDSGKSMDSMFWSRRPNLSVPLNQVMHSPEPAATLNRSSLSEFASTGLKEYDAKIKRSIQHSNQSHIRIAPPQVDPANIISQRSRNKAVSTPADSTNLVHQKLQDDIVIEIRNVGSNTEESFGDLDIVLEEADQDDLNQMSEFAGGSKKNDLQ